MEETIEIYNHQQYRDQLAREIVETPKDERPERLTTARQSDMYLKSRIFKIEERFRKFINEQYRKFDEHDVKFDPDNPPDYFQGVTGRYKFIDYSKLLYYSILSDDTGREFFVTTKKPERQALACIIGRYLCKDKPYLARLKFPEIRLEKINGKTVALVEYFDGYNELGRDKEEREIPEQLNFFTDEEKAFLEIYNIWIGNWDFKYDHVLVSSEKNSVGLIDLEMSFDFGRRNRIDKIVARSIFLGEEISDETKKKIIKIISDLDTSDWNTIIKYAVESGFKPNETIQVVSELYNRRESLDEEVQTIRALYKARKKL